MQVSIRSTWPIQLRYYNPMHHNNLLHQSSFLHCLDFHYIHYHQWMDFQDKRLVCSCDQYIHIFSNVHGTQVRCGSMLLRIDPIQNTPHHNEPSWHFHHNNLHHQKSFLRCLDIRCSMNHQFYQSMFRVPIRSIEFIRWFHEFSATMHYEFWKKLRLIIYSYVLLKFIYSEKATKFCKISTNYLSYVLPVK